MRFRFVLLIVVFAIHGTQAQNPNGLNFDGSNDFVDTDFNGISGTNARTVEAWIKTTYIATQEVVTDWGSMSTGQRFTLNLIAGKLRCEIGGQGVTGSTNIADNSWHHVAVTFNNSSSPKFRLYVDGSLEAAFNLNNVTMNTSSSVPFRIGKRVDGANHFIGTIDEVRVWNYDRSASEISSNMYTEFCTIPNGLVAYHKLNQGIAGGSNNGVDESPDVSGNGNDGELNGFSLSGSTSNWVTGYNLNTSSVSSNISLTGCDSLISPSGNYTWTQSGTYYDTIQTSAGCDSNMTINVSIIPNSYTSYSVSECYSYTSPSGNHTWYTSGTYTDTLDNAAGCDSVLTIDLTINNTSDTISLSDCGSVLSPSGNHVWTQSGAYLDTIPNSVGCDSVLLVNATVLSTSTKSLAPEACLSYTSPSGNYTWTSSGNYTDTLVNAIGCDSIISINLTIKEVNVEVDQLGYKLTAQANNAIYQWLDCEDDYAVIPGSNGKSYTTEVDGSFAVRVSNNGCTDTSDCIDIEIVGIDAVNESLITYRLDPIDNTIAINPTNVHTYNVRVYDLLGKLISTYSSQTNVVNIDLENDGAYLLHIESEGKVETYRVVL